MHYFVHHESRVVWSQVSDVPKADDGLVGECDEPRFWQLVDAGYANASAFDLMPTFNTTPPTEDIDPWT